jgi:hypothetical protein
METPDSSPSFLQNIIEFPSSCSNYIFSIYYSIATHFEEMNNDSATFLREYLGLDE